MTMNTSKHEAWAETAMIIVEICWSTSPKIWNSFTFINNAKKNYGAAVTRSWIYNDLSPFIDELFWKYYPDGGPAYDLEFVPFILSLIDEYWQATHNPNYIDYTISHFLNFDQLNKDKFNFVYAEAILSQWNNQ